METHKTEAIIAKKKAISDVELIVVLAFVIAFLSAFSAYILIWIGFSATLSDTGKIVASSALGLTSGTFFNWWFSRRIPSKVETAIDTAVIVERKKLEESSPERAIAKESMESEYACIIPQRQRGDFQWPQRGKCQEQLVRDVITQGLDSTLLKKISTWVVRDISGHRRERWDDFSQEEKNLHTDIRLYLEAWMTTSIKYGRKMRVEWIEPKYSKRSIHIKAFETMHKDTKRYMRNPVVTEAMSIAIEKSIFSSDFDSQTILEDATQIIEEHLLTLRDELVRLNPQRSNLS